MADSLRWLTMAGFPGIDETRSDHYVQPRSAHGPALMRRLLSIDPFSKPGRFVPAGGYAQWDAAAGDQGIFSTNAVADGTLLRVSEGIPYKYAGDHWDAVTADTGHYFDEHCDRVRFAAAYDGIFAVDGHTKPKVIYWSHASHGADARLDYSSDDMIANILNTGGGSGTDFLAEFVCFHSETIVLAAGSTCRMSVPYELSNFYDAADASAANRYWQVAEGDGTRITGLYSFEGKMLMVAKSRSLHAFTGSDPTSTFERLVLDPAVGLYAPDSLAAGGGAIWGCGYEGPWRFTTTKGIEMIGGLIQAVWDTMTPLERTQVTGWWDHERYNIVLPIWSYTDYIETKHAEAKHRYTYDPASKMWAQGFGVVGPTTIHAPSSAAPLILTANGTVIYEQDTTATSINTHDVMHEILTPALEFGDAHRDKWIRRLRIELEHGPATIELAYRLDGNPTWSTETLTANNPINHWGDASLHWGDGTKYSAGGNYTIDLPVTWHGKSLTLRLRGKGLKVSSIGIGYEYEVV